MRNKVSIILIAIVAIVAVYATASLLAGSALPIDLAFHLDSGLVFGAIAVRSADAISEKWSAKAAASSGDYKDGIEFAGSAWQESTSGAAQNYADGVQASIARGAFKKGVDKAGNEKWKKKSTSLGAQRFSPGVQAAKGDFREGIKGPLDVIANTTLPPRYPTGDPRNRDRSTVVQENLRKFATGS